MANKQHTPTKTKIIYNQYINTQSTTIYTITDSRQNMVNKLNITLKLSKICYLY